MAVIQVIRRTLANPLLYERFKWWAISLNGDEFDEELIDPALTWDENVKELERLGWKVKPDVDLTYVEYDLLVDQARIEMAPIKAEAKVTAKIYIPKLWNILIDIAQKNHEDFDPIKARRKIEDDCRDIWVLSTIRDALGDRGKDPSKQKGGRASGDARRTNIWVPFPKQYLSEIKLIDENEADILLEIRLKRFDKHIQGEVVDIHSSIVPIRHPIKVSENEIDEDFNKLREEMEEKKSD